MPAGFEIPVRASEAEDEEVPETDFSAFEVVLGVHGSEDVVVRDLAVEASDEAGKAVLTDEWIEFVVCDQVVSPSSLLETATFRSRLR